MKKVIMILMALLLLAFPIQVQASSHQTPQTALNIELGKQYERAVDYYNDRNNYYVKFTIPDDGIVSLDIEKPIDSQGATYNYRISLINEQGHKLIDEMSTNNLNVMDDSYIIKTGLKSGTYYINLYPSFIVQSGVFRTKYKVSFEKNNHVEFEPNDGITTASNVSIGNFIFGTMTKNDDYYSFYSTKNQTAYLTIPLDSYYAMDNSTIQIKGYNAQGGNLGVKTPGYSGWLLSPNKKYYILPFDLTAGENIIAFWNLSRYLEYEFGVFLEDSVTEISIAKLPSNINYTKSDKLDVSGGKLRVNTLFEDKVINLTTSMVSGFNFNSNKYGTQKLAVKYGGKETYFQINYNRFRDVPPTHTFYSPIIDLVNREIINGYSDGTFRPSNSLTRAQAAVMIIRSVGLSTKGVHSNFSDVSSNHTTYGFISAAYQAGIINGYNDGTFRPNNPVTRAQIATMVARAFDFKHSGKQVEFGDVPNNYSPRVFIEILASHDIVSGKDGKFNPTSNVTRGQFSKIISNSIDLIAR